MSQLDKTVKPYGFKPDYDVIPGATLQETIDALGIDQVELAVRLGLDKKTVNQIIKGLAPITRNTAIRLERVTDVPANLWNNLEMNYREGLARKEERRRLLENLNWLEEIPRAELVNRGVVERKRDRVLVLQQVLSFFGVATVDAWKKLWLAPRFSFRKSPAFAAKPGAMATWLRLGELQARTISCRPHDRVRFKASLDAIRGLTLEAPRVFVPKIREFCANAGVAVVLVPEIKGAPASGATQWVTPERAILQLSLRYKTNDHFWFSFFHEAGHILHDGKKEKFVDSDRNTREEREAKADRFAAHHLIPRRYTGALRELNSWKAIKRFAAFIGIAPGIVVGRLQREGVIRYDQFNGLKRRFHWGGG